jgi:hypothetical protein
MEASGPRIWLIRANPRNPRKQRIIPLMTRINADIGTECLLLARCRQSLTVSLLDAHAGFRIFD